MPTIMGGQDNDIDSYAFVKLIGAIPFAEILLKVDGSYALAAFDRKQQRLYFARNFRGLYFSFWCGPEGDEYIVWSSEEESLVDPDHRERYTIVEMPPYSFQGFNIWNLLQWRDREDLFSGFMKDFVTLDEYQKIKTGYNKNSAVVVFSGGLDSTVCATMACEQYKTVHLLHFKYGARAEEQEIKSVTEISHFLKAKFPQTNIFLKFIDMDFIKNLGGSTLTDHTLSIAQGEQGVETDHEWVPARNIAMIGLTTSYCDRYDIGNIILGLNMEEGSVFCDNSVEFYKAMEKALNLGSHSRPKMHMPVGNMMKHHIYKKGVDIGAPLDLSWSCYEGGEERCGTCGPCTMRRRAAAMNGIRDNVPYTNEDIESEKILQYYGTKT
jgi:7-cyano-7-deazaguanine synthase